ncbi:integrin beta-1-binding protein 2 isoform X1 [Equus asinus]|uniref:Integrin beta-1-binding protein 2 n=3 Tax=Equus TaxID=9789 RepID=F6VK41_HORSE|nr:integrin beta-1-binding protein 2 isoform X1 [Equus caballus]XP_008508537.1 PREDICTED: integrin beta-1-binding protein 2 isoform X1 [Equus przewalskii]XP_014693180.1 integrin beta-1-binding protein 2 isoform X1 [Equus asinus]
MSLLCHNKGCGQHFDPSTNLPDSCCHHPGVPIFHDALKGWSCCRKRTVDFSEFLNIKGCTVGPHCAEKLPEAPQPEGPATSNSLQEQKPLNMIPKSAETLRRERPKSELLPKLLPLNISQALEMALEQKELDQKPGAGLDSSLIRTGSSCQNPGCDAVYQGPESDATPCTYHPGAPRFHEGMKSWSCCGIQTLDFGAFLAQPGCRVGRHDWGKQLPASCRHDWHQTDSLVVVTVYGQIPLPAFNWVKASQTELHVHIVFDGNRVFQAQMKLWGVINVEQSSVSLMPSRVEISLVKADPGSWAQLEHPDALAEKAKAGVGLEMDEEESEDSDDDLSWTEEEEEEEAMGE